MNATAPLLSSLSQYLTLDPTPIPTKRHRQADWLDVIALANMHLLAPTLYEQMVAKGHDRDLPDDAADYLALLLDLNERRNAALRRQAVELIRALNALGIQPVLLKGAVTLFDVGDPLQRSRMMRDLDVLVPPHTLDAAVAVLRDLGYRVHERYARGHHAYGEFVRSGTAGTVDLHTELVDPKYVLPASELRHRARPLATESVDAFLPAPTDRMLHHLVHAQVHHLARFYRGELMLNQVFEFALQGQRLRREIDWPFIARRMAEHRLTVALQSYLLAAERLFGMTWPLAAEPTAGASLHASRCLWQLRHPRVSRMLAPLGNLRSGFAWHRMNALYGGAGTMTARRLQHAVLFLRKKSVRQMLDRVFRYE